MGSLSDPLVSAGLLVALAVLMLVVGLALQARANGGIGPILRAWVNEAWDSGRSSLRGLSSKERADDGRARARGGLVPVPAPAANNPPAASTAPVARNEPIPRNEPVAKQEPVPEQEPAAKPEPVASSEPPSQQPWMPELDARVAELGEELDTWIDTWVQGIQSSVELAQEPDTNGQPPDDQSQPLAGQSQPPEVKPRPEGQSRPPEGQPQSPEREPRIEPRMGELPGSKRSDDGPSRIATAGDVASEDGVQDENQVWMEEFTARIDAAEEGCERADETLARLARLIGRGPGA